MIFVTGLEIRVDLKLLSGVLLDSFPADDFRKDIFKAYSGADSALELTCELPHYAGLLSKARDGLFVGEIESKLLGVRRYTYVPDPYRIASSFAENRIELLTTSEVRNVVFPFFLDFKPVERPVRTQVNVVIEIGKLADLPDFLASTVRDQYARRTVESSTPIKPSMILPVQNASRMAAPAAALQIAKQMAENEYEAWIYTEAGQEPPRSGDVLERRVRVSRGSKKDEPIEFHARIGWVK